MKKYYLKKRWLIFFAGLAALPLALAVVIFVVLYFSESDPRWVITLFTFLGILEILSTVRMVTSINIVVSDTAIVYTLLGRSMRANWADVEGVTSRKSRFGKQEYLVADSEVEIGFIGGLFDKGSMRRALLKRLIPIEWFADNGRESELGQQIKQYAPNLFP